MEEGRGILVAQFHHFAASVVVDGESEVGPMCFRYHASVDDDPTFE